MLERFTTCIQLEGSVNQLARTEAKLHVQDVSESMLPNQAELGSEALESLRQMQRPLKTSSKFKKFRKGGPNPLAIKQTGSKKTKRPGPRLRNALKAAALAEQGVQDPKGRFCHAKLNSLFKPFKTAPREGLLARPSCQTPKVLSSVLILRTLISMALNHNTDS